MYGSVRHPNPHQRIRHRLFEPVDADLSTGQTLISARHVPHFDDCALRDNAVPGRGIPAILREDRCEAIRNVLITGHLPNNPDRSGVGLIQLEAGWTDVVGQGGRTRQEPAQQSDNQRRCVSSIEHLGENETSLLSSRAGHVQVVGHAFQKNAILRTKFLVRLLRARTPLL